MKKTLIATVLVTILSVPAFAGDSFLSFSLGYGGYHHGLGYGIGYTHTVHRPAPVVVRHQPAVVVRHQPSVQVVYRSTGHWEWRERKIWVEGQFENVWVPPRYQEIYVPGHYDIAGNWIEGHHERRLLAEGYYRKEWKPGFCRVERTKVWVP